MDGDVSGHTPEFQAAAGSPRGFDAMLAAAKGLAMTVLDVMYRPGAVDEMWSAWRSSVKGGRLTDHGRLCPEEETIKLDYCRPFPPPSCSPWLPQFSPLRMSVG